MSLRPPVVGGARSAEDDQDADGSPVEPRAVEGIGDGQRDRGRHGGLNGGESRQLRAESPAAGVGLGRRGAVGERLGSGGQGAIEGDDAREGRPFLGGEGRLLLECPQAASVGVERFRDRHQ